MPDALPTIAARTVWISRRDYEPVRVVAANGAFVYFEPMPNPPKAGGKKVEQCMRRELFYVRYQEVKPR